jgi:hypothetical protein
VEFISSSPRHVDDKSGKSKDIQPTPSKRDVSKAAAISTSK